MPLDRSDDTTLVMWVFALVILIVFCVGMAAFRSDRCTKDCNAARAFPTEAACRFYCDHRGYR